MRYHDEQHEQAYRESITDEVVSDMASDMNRDERREALEEFMHYHGKKKAGYLPFGCNGFNNSAAFERGSISVKKLILEKAFCWKVRCDMGLQQKWAV